MQLMTTAENNKRIAQNTLMLYFRMLFTMAVSLYTSRVVLNTLGVEDFGIYNVVGGVVAMLALLNGSLSGASQRFITFEIGKNDKGKLAKVFTSIVTIHLLLAIIVVMVAETAGLWFLNSRMNISPDRIIAANWVYQFSLIAFLVNLLSVPYNAAIIAHERMKAFAYIGVLETSLKLGAVLLTIVLPFDRLKSYSFLIMALAIIIRVIYGVYSSRNFSECKFKINFDKQLFKSIGAFTGWNFIGAGSSILMTQGVNVLLNLFFGVVVNAAQGVANQVYSAVNGFVMNFMTALNPQITKSYASGDKGYTVTLVFQGARFSFYLLLFLSLPILIETNTILTLWLKVVPEFTVLFVRLTLVNALSQALSHTLITVMLATGNIKRYQLVVGGLQLLNFPLAYLFFKLGYDPYISLVVAIVISQVCLIARLLMLHSMIDLPIMQYFKKVYFNVFAVGCVSLLIPSIVFNLMNDDLFRLFMVVVVSVLSTAISIYVIGLSQDERSWIRGKLLEQKKKLLGT